MLTPLPESNRKVKSDLPFGSEFGSCFCSRKGGRWSEKFGVWDNVTR